ncbi:probable polygalacturonase At1g80170 isoform X1 [Ziziphus jujuba]|nr:probable polygalacturonase At1g80170 isoform X1 [Ziziphus jujuba]XP_048333999.1 probable polygalacturonase At1g80170 isoform X1 [Ziziphus jujuba]XP_048334002.1 probable polygalacturonase At1g80170 isoform X1 [Ziziphus jujuba var. spinosa]
MHAYGQTPRNVSLFLTESVTMKRSSSCASTCFISFVHMLIVFGSSKLTCTHGFESLLQLPQSGSTRTRPRFKRVFFLADFGAKGDGIANDTKAFIDAWEMACSFPLRTRLVIPVGSTYLVYPVNLGGPCRSKVTLKISGTIIAPKDPDVWIGLNPRKWLYFHGVNHLTVEGGGTINGMGKEWWARSCKRNSTNPCRHAPTAITFHRCKNLKVKNLMLVNSQQMHMAFTNCIRVLASHLKVIAPATSPNTDGVHISASKGVEIKESIIRTGDDCISIVSNSSRIKIRNIVCGPGHGISIGSLGKSKSRAEVHDIIVDGAFISNTENGVRIKTWQGGRGFASRITFQNLLMKNVSNPIIIDQYYCDSLLPCPNKTLAVKVENISFIHIKGTSATEEAIKFSCSDDWPCEGLYLEDIQLHSYNRGVTRSFCWEAYGLSLGLVDPPACFSSSGGFIKEKGLSDSAIHSF